MDPTLLYAGCIAYNSLVCLLRFPGGLVNIGKIHGVWLFIHADLMALFISMAVLIFRITVGPRFWKKVEGRAKKAMGIAIVSFVIAFHQVLLTVVGDDFWLRSFITGSAIGSVGPPVLLILILRSVYGQR